MTPEAAKDLLVLVMTSLPNPYMGLCRVVLDTKEFWEAPGAKSHHHNYTGGLAVHTAEVVHNCAGVVNMDYNVLLTAAIWHDYMKIRDYEFVLDDRDEGKIDYTDYKRKIYHIAGSFAAFTERAHEYGLEQDKIDAIGHCILSHHGRPEWGSAIQPQTPEALTLHWADCMSAWFENGTYKEKR